MKPPVGRISVGISALALLGATLVSAGAEEVRTESLAPADPSFQPGDTIPVTQGEVVEASALCSSGRVLNTTFWHLGNYGPLTERTRFEKLTNDDVNGATTRFMVPFDVEPGNYPLSLQCVSGDGTQYYTLEVSTLDQAPGTPLDLVTSWTFGDESANDDLWAIEPLANGDVALVGSTEGDLAGTNAGVVDGWVAVYQPNGTLRWSAQIGGAGVDLATEVVQLTGGANSGAIAIVGLTDDDLDGAGSLGTATDGSDAWVQVRDSMTGAVLMTELIDGYEPVCSNLAGYQYASDVVALIDGGFMVIGITDESINPTGFGCIIAPGPVSVQSASVSPQSATPLGSEDVFGVRYGDSLNKLGGAHFGTSDADTWARADATADDLVLAIETEGAVIGTNAGLTDVALVVVDIASLAVTSENQFGGPGEESITNVLVVNEAVWVTGQSDSSPSVTGTASWPLRSDRDGNVTPGAAWLTARTLADGSEVLFRTFDSEADDCAGGLAADSLNRVWAVGGTGSGLTEASADMDGSVIVADTSGILHAEQFGGVGGDYAYDAGFTPDGTFIAAGVVGDLDCSGPTGPTGDVFVRLSTQAPPPTTTTSTTTTTAAPSTPVVAAPASSTTTTATSSIASSTTVTTVASESTVADPVEVLPSTGSSSPILPLLVLLLAGGGFAMIITRRSV